MSDDNTVECSCLPSSETFGNLIPNGECPVHGRPEFRRPQVLAGSGETKEQAEAELSRLEHLNGQPDAVVPGDIEVSVKITMKMTPQGTSLKVDLSSDDLFADTIIDMCQRVARGYERLATLQTLSDAQQRSMQSMVAQQREIAGLRMKFGKGHRIN